MKGDQVVYNGAENIYIIQSVSTADIGLYTCIVTMTDKFMFGGAEYPVTTDSSVSNSYDLKVVGEYLETFWSLIIHVTKFVTTNYYWNREKR